MTTPTPTSTLLSTPTKCICIYCSKSFSDNKRLKAHTQDCFRKNTDDAPERLCSLCNADYTKKSGSAYRTHIRKCENTDKLQSSSAVKQSERRRTILESAICTYCNDTFVNISVGKFGDHRYKCKKQIPNYDKDYQLQYREDIKRYTEIVYEYYPDMKGEDCKQMSQIIRRLIKDEHHTGDDIGDNNKRLVEEAYSKLT